MLRRSTRWKPPDDERDRPPARADDLPDDYPNGIQWSLPALDITDFVEVLGGTQPRDGRPWAGVVPLRNPITGIVGCPRAASGQATVAPPRSVVNSRRLIVLAPGLAPNFQYSKTIACRDSQYGGYSAKIAVHLLTTSPKPWVFPGPGLHLGARQRNPSIAAPVATAGDAAPVTVVGNRCRRPRPQRPGIGAQHRIAVVIGRRPTGNGSGGLPTWRKRIARRSTATRRAAKRRWQHSERAGTGCSRIACA